MNGILKEMAKCAIIQRDAIKKYGGYAVNRNIVIVIDGKRQYVTEQMV